MVKERVSPPEQYRAHLRGYRQSASKARLVADMVRGRNVVDALNVLKFSPNRAARPLEKLIRSAMANAVQHSNKNNLGLEENSLVICEARIDQGMAFTRFRPRSRGMATPIQRKFCHMEVKLTAPQDLERLKLYRNIQSQKLRVDRIADLKGLVKQAPKGKE